LERGQPVVGMGRRSRPYKNRRPLEETNRCDPVNEHPVAGADGDTCNGLASFDRSMSAHGTAGDSTSCDTEVPRSHAPRPPRHRGGDLDVCPAPEPPQTGHPFGDEPADLSGRDCGNVTTSGPARDEPSRARRHDPSGLWPRESQYVLGAAAERSASRHRGVIATCRSQENLVPTLGYHALLNQQKTWTG
jgi:hypothetical protein